MHRLALYTVLFVFPLAANAQSAGPLLHENENTPSPQLVAAVNVPIMSADLALATYKRHAARQMHDLGGYSAATVVRAELPASSQKGEFYLERYFHAPR